jgi:hypothetical protein
MNIPGAYPGEHPILALWVEGGHIHSCWSAWTVHYSGSQDGYLLRRDGSYVGMAYRGGSQPISFRWYGVAPEGWEGLARWHGETTQLFERVLQQALP